MNARKACWTCTARKIHCDGHLPTCHRCARAQRKCEGYEMRLSWPKDNDKKRAIVGDSPPEISRLSRRNNLFVNTTWQDMQVYRDITLRMQPPFSHLVRTVPKLWIQPQPCSKHSDLIQHFHNTAHLSLVTFTTGSIQIRDALIRMALARDSAPGLALFFALLSFSSLHRSGLHQQAIQLKIAALQYLSAPVRGGRLSSAEAAQHVAASMLLSAFEILLPSGSSCEWLLYVWGAMDIAQATSLQDREQGNDIDHILDWAYYHNAVSRFPIYHWRQRSLPPETTAVKYPNTEHLQQMSLARYRPALPSPNPTHAILNLLSELCDKLYDPWDPKTRSEDYHNSLKTLESRAEKVLSTPSLAESSDDTRLGVKIWQLATRIYLARASQSQWESSINLESEIEEAFYGIVTVCLCKHAFPLLIVACEARSDERRAAIMDLIDRTERESFVRNFGKLRDTIQSIWVQQDLHADGDLLVNYLGIISTVISSSTTLPFFV
ncbi:fungal-specific transcription factor domain-containing protein [Trichoderma austrokoningii]